MKKSTRILIPTLLLAVAASLLPACNKEAEQQAYDKQETNIAKFVEAQLKADETAKVTYKDGTVRVVLHDTLEREGLLADTLQAGGTVSFYYAGYLLTGRHQPVRHQPQEDGRCRRMETLRHDRFLHPDPHPGRPAAPGPAARPGRRPEPGRMLYPLFGEICLRFPRPRHDSCKVSPGLPHLGGKHFQ